MHIDKAAAPGALAQPDHIAQVLDQLRGKQDEMVLQIGADRIRLSSLNKPFWPKNQKLKQPLVTKIRRRFDARKSRKTLARHYVERRKLFAEDFPDFYDADLRAIFDEVERAA